jgi:hypothetical protein
MQLRDFLKPSLRIAGWSIAGVFALSLIWLAANRLFDARLDPRRDAFVKSADGEIQDAKNMAIGIAGLAAPRGADSMKHGAEIKKLYEQHAPWSDIRLKIFGPDELKLTVESEQVSCWMDPDWPGPKGCLPFEKAPQVLAENREILGRYKALYKLDRHVTFRYLDKNLIPLTKLIVAEMRLDMRNGKHEAAYAKWREHFRFTRNHLRGEDDWVGKAIGLVNFGMSLSVIEDLLVKQPSLARSHFDELLDLLRPEGIEMINPSGVVRTQYLHLEYFFEAPNARPEFEDSIDWLARKLGQRNRIQNRYLAYSMDHLTALRQPWSNLRDELAKSIDHHLGFGWEDLIDPVGSLFLSRNVGWQIKLVSLLRQAYISDGNLRLATLVVRMSREKVKDGDIPVFLAGVGPELYDPFARKPMHWDPKNGRIYFVSNDDGCSIAPFRVPVWDVKSARKPAKLTEWTIC